MAMRIASDVWVAPIFWSMLARWISTVRGLIANCSAIARFEFPAAIALSTSRSRRVSRPIRLRAAASRNLALPTLSARSRALASVAASSASAKGQIR
jgi:hypothetical protein